jgi:SAM-dependent methyltransferase
MSGSVTNVIADSPDAMQLSLAACAWCDAPLARAVAGVAGAHRCASCGSRTEAWPSDAELAALLAQEPGGMTPARRCSAAEALRRRARRRLAERVARIAPPGAVLDVGSGDGTLLDALRAAGRVATGIGRPSTRADVRDVEITEVGGRYAAIVFWQSLGRASAPRTALEHAAALLKPDGLLTIAQPTTLALPALTERWRGVAAPAQRIRIPQRALVERLRALGLDVTHADRMREGAGTRPGAWSATLLGGVVSVEARRWAPGG